MTTYESTDAFSGIGSTPSALLKSQSLRPSAFSRLKLVVASHSLTVYLDDCWSCLCAFVGNESQTERDLQQGFEVLFTTAFPASLGVVILWLGLFCEKPQCLWAALIILGISLVIVLAMKLATVLRGTTSIS